MTEYALARIESEAKRMGALVADLLLLARLDEGQDLHTTCVDLADLLVNAVNDARVSAPLHRWSVVVPESAVMVNGDNERLHQLVANLLSNARVHTPPGTAVVATLTTMTDDRDVVTAELTITDNGPGIAPDLLKTLFQRFVRGDKARSRETDSTGLGWQSSRRSSTRITVRRVSSRLRPGRRSAFGFLRSNPPALPPSPISASGRPRSRATNGLEPTKGPCAGAGRSIRARPDRFVQSDAKTVLRKQVSCCFRCRRIVLGRASPPRQGTGRASSRRGEGEDDLADRFTGTQPIGNSLDLRELHGLVDHGTDLTTCDGRDDLR